MYIKVSVFYETLLDLIKKIDLYIKDKSVHKLVIPVVKFKKFNVEVEIGNTIIDFDMAFCFDTVFSISFYILKHFITEVLPVHLHYNKNSGFTCSVLQDVYIPDTRFNNVLELKCLKNIVNLPITI